MGSGGDPPANKGAAGFKEDAIHFVNARPASETERLNIKRMVRAHVGKWISTQTKDRAAGSAVVEPPPLAPPPPPPFVTSAVKTEPSSHPFELDTDGPYFPSPSASSTLSPASTASSRASPESCASNISHFAPAPPPPPPPPPSTFSAQPQAITTLAIIPSRTIPSQTDPVGATSLQQCDGHDGYYEYAGSSDSDTPSPPPSGEYIEAMGAGRLDPFRVYPLHLEPELIRTSEEYCLSCLWPGLTPGPSGTNMSSWFPMSQSDPTLFTAFLYGSLSHMRVQSMNGWIPQHLFRPRQQRLLEMVEMETIKMVSREMDNPSRAVCDAMIFSVVCMAHNNADDNVGSFRSTPFTAPLQRLQWLDVYGSLRPNLVHIRGLVQMVNLRGGIDKIQLPGLASVISFSDLVTASTFLSSPVFPFVSLEDSRKSQGMQELLGYPDSGVEHYFSHFRHLGLPRSLAEIFCAMNTYTNLVDQCIEGRMNYDPCLLADQRNVVQYNLLLLPPAPQPSNTFTYGSHEIIYEACRLASLVYGVGVILPLPAQSTPLGRLAELIHNHLHVSTHPHIWSTPQAQVALVWILTLGGIAADNTRHRPWFVDILRQVTQNNKISSYDDLKRYLHLLAWHPVACDKPGTELWLDVEKSRSYSPN